MEVNETATTRRPASRLPGQGRTIAIVGDICRCLATGAETGGKCAVFEVIVPPGGGPPPHIHTREEESFYILEGTMTFRTVGEEIRAEAGTHVSLPPGIAHTFANESGARVRMLLTVMPAGFDEFFLEVGRPLPDGATTADPPTQEEIDRLLAAAPRYGITMLGP